MTSNVWTYSCSFSQYLDSGRWRIGSDIAGRGIVLACLLQAGFSCVCLETLLPVKLLLRQPVYLCPLRGLIRWCACDAHWWYLSWWLALLIVSSLTAIAAPAKVHAFWPACFAAAWLPVYAYWAFLFLRPLQLLSDLFQGSASSFLHVGPLWVEDLLPLVMALLMALLTILRPAT